MSILYFILAAFGLGLLIFIHELGHYYMARRVGMRVEAFGIGFGKPIYTWHHKGVKWNICWLPFGGYVRIAGMEKENGKEPSDIPDGFFGKSPMDRIKVAIMGPLVNIVAALFFFSLIWISGGREKPFSEFTRIIGWVDTDSQLYKNGVHGGDSIVKYNNLPFNGFQDLMYASLLSEKTLEINGFKIDYATGERTPYDYTLDTYPDPRAIDPSIRTIGVFSPARYLIFNNGDNGSPLLESGIQKGDRIAWVDGQLLFSMNQLSQIINDAMTYVTVQRGAEIIQMRIPRVKLNDIQFTSDEYGEITDWQHEAQLKTGTDDIYFIPYNLNHRNEVEGTVVYLDANSDEHMPESKLQKGDVIIAVDGTQVSSASELMKQLQTRALQIIVQRGQDSIIPVKEADQDFIASYSMSDLNAIAKNIGTGQLVKDSGQYHLLKPVVPKRINELHLYLDKKESYEHAYNEARKKILEEVVDSKERSEALRQLDENQKKWVLGFMPHDRPVQYNPSPFQLFGDVYDQMYRTIKGLVTGYLSPKWMSGPVGIVQVFHHGWSVGVNEALFWMGLISLNLGLINLLPLPVLDGGHILLSVVEMIRGKPLKSKTMERIMIPFVVLIIGAFIYFTYNDLARLFGKFF